ncbi:GNAT family N-acetyltransferase [Streptomyces sp. NPDC057242]|uniref:GNAT family N-acetyltransferase n=1 Tax=unclassified Streptomyces TaxID=2593676 RepID=UPI00363E8B1C
MNHDHDTTGLTVGDRDPEPAKRLDRGLDAYDFAATGTSLEDRSGFPVKAVDPATGEVVGGITARTWAGLLGIDMLWVHEEHRRDGRGGRLLRAAEDVHFHKDLTGNPAGGEWENPDRN